MRPHTEAPRTPAEERLRAAFAARAALVTHRDLRRDAPPRGRSWGTRRVRGAAFAALGAAVAVAAAYLLVLASVGPVAPAPAPPARPPGSSESPVRPTPPPDPATPSPSVARPDRGEPEPVEEP
ncbi:hypothetical protein [Streptomyces sp. NPDC002057]|uniref:hypothetical protein n=1 Tax=Streptomyces sp. NPDC002057 TaxID=3154664 RepID=UPI003319A9E2